MKIRKIIIAGSREFNDYNFLEKKMLRLFPLEKYSENMEIISGTANGADKLGEQLAKKYKISLIEHPANWNDVKDKPKGQIATNSKGEEYWKIAGFVRNEEMAKYADILCLFWDGKSKGSKHMLDTAIRYQLECHLFIT